MTPTGAGERRGATIGAEGTVAKTPRERLNIVRVDPDALDALRKHLDATREARKRAGAPVDMAPLLTALVWRYLDSKEAKAFTA